LKKLLVMSVLAMAAFGFAGAAHADACSDPVSVNCTHAKSDGSTESCELWVNTGLGTPVDGCNNPL
jgi:hypothetical protein